MGRIRVTCSACGEQDLPSAQVRGRTCLDDGRGQYRFTCPDCGDVVLRNGEPRTIDLLEASGVVIERWNLPQELFERRSGDVINHDDLHNFHDSLGNQADFEQAVADLET